jgi:hypothetical protein
MYKPTWDPRSDALTESEGYTSLSPSDIEYRETRVGELKIEVTQPKVTKFKIFFVSLTGFVFFIIGKPP